MDYPLPREHLNFLGSFRSKGICKERHFSAREVEKSYRFVKAGLALGEGADRPTKWVDHHGGVVTILGGDRPEPLILPGARRKWTSTCSCPCRHSPPLVPCRRPGRRRPPSARGHRHRHPAPSPSLGKQGSCRLFWWQSGGFESPS